MLLPNKSGITSPTSVINVFTYQNALHLPQKSHTVSTKEICKRSDDLKKMEKEICKSFSVFCYLLFLYVYGWCILYIVGNFFVEFSLWLFLPDDDDEKNSWTNEVHNLWSSMASAVNRVSNMGRKRFAVKRSYYSR